MNRQKRTLIVLSIALAAALTASYGVYAAISRIPVREVEIATSFAVVASRQMAVGSMVTKDDVKLVAWPTRTPLEGGFKDVNEVVNRGLTSPVTLNEPITENKLAPKNAGAGLPPTITQGMRAMSVKVNEVIGVAGFVVPGTRVDVLAVLRNDRGEDPVARTVVSNVQVLTAGTRYDQEEAKAEGKAIRSSVVTLMVSPLDAERITLAEAEGQLMLALRHPLDVDMTETPGVRKAALFGPVTAPAPVPTKSSGVRSAPAPKPLPVVAPAPAPRRYIIETIRAAKRTEDVLN
jgi:pilus assembly protein CpaB